MNSTQLIKKCSSEKEITQLLELLLTDKEYQALQERIKIIQELSEGKTQREIAQTINCSVVTVTRGAKVYNQNKEFFLHLLETEVKKKEETNKHKKKEEKKHKKNSKK
jgi:Trp operon repressor